MLIVQILIGLVAMGVLIVVGAALLWLVAWVERNCGDDDDIMKGGGKPA